MIVVTAPIGRIGTHLLDELVSGSEPVRLIARDPDRLPPRVRARTEVIVGSHRDPDVIDRALDGADALFWLMPADPTASGPFEAYVTNSIPAAEAVVRRGVPRVVLVSSLGRGSGLYAGHVSGSLAMEDLFRSTGVHLRALAMPGFMENVLRQVGGLREGVLSATLPAHLGVPWVATADIAAVAARHLRDRSWAGQESLPVIGPEELSYAEIAALLSEVLSRRIAFRPGDRDADRSAAIAYGFSPAMAESLLAMDVAVERGLYADAVGGTSARTPTTFRTFAAEVVAPAVNSLA